MATPISLNGGTFLRETDYSVVRSSVDSTNLFEFWGGKKEMADLGMVDFFANSGFLPMQMSRMNTAKRVFLDTHDFKYSYPTAQEEFYILESFDTTGRAGIGGSTFKVKMNSRKYSNGWILTPDPQVPLAVVVTEDEITGNRSEGFIYTLRLVGQNLADRVWPAEFLRPGKRYYGTGTVDSEYNQTYSQIPEFGGGKREFMAMVGTSGQQLRYEITREAAKSTVPNSSLIAYDNFLKVVQTYQFAPGTLGYELSMLSPEQKQSFGGDVLAAYKANYKTESQAEAAMARDTLVNLWAPKVEMLGVKLLTQMIETQAYYGPGGSIKFDGSTSATLPLGLFHQYMLGNTANYNINNFTLEMLEIMVTSRITGKMDYDPSQAGPEIVLKTGKGGLTVVHNLLSKRPSQDGLLWTVDNIVQGLGGDNRRLHYAAPRFNSWIAGNGIRFRVDYEPSLDPIEADNDINPIVPVNVGGGGYRLSSYIFIIDDLRANDVSTNGQPNIHEIYYAPDWELRQSYTNGKMAYPGTEQNGRWHRATDHPGFVTTLEMRNKAYWLADPTRSLVLKPLNPKTGKPIFDYR